jgi:hypothetical protein
MSLPITIDSSRKRALVITILGAIGAFIANILGVAQPWGVTVFLSATMSAITYFITHDGSKIPPIQKVA